jgi:hypothetical protein
VTHILDPEELSKIFREIAQVVSLCFVKSASVICSTTVSMQAAHLLTQCNFNEAMWGRVVSTLQLPTHLVAINMEGLVKCLEKVLAVGDKKKTRGVMAACFFHFGGKMRNISYMHFLLATII